MKEIGCSFEVPLFPYCFKVKFYCFLLVLFACNTAVMAGNDTF